ncbi:MAG TPA: Nif3-like dinuclear metal center hexameric protein [Luteitalea sp.]|nr:Nif3-like dinuclear metal center hexameric protein [Luteitalea sp.]
MSLTRRSFLHAVGVAGLAGQARPTLTAQDVVARIQKQVGIPWMTETVDRIVAGRPDAPVRGVATTMMATYQVLQRAARAGRNLVITHEPTFWSHQDTTEAIANDPTYRHKRDFITANDLVVFRFHDHWHRMTPDGIATGMARALGWQRYAIDGQRNQFALPATTLGALVKTMEGSLKVQSMRVVGNPQLPVRRVAASWGYASLMPRLIETAAQPGIDVIIVGETREWELVEYVQDQIASGLPKALIMINHVVSEQAGMSYCAEWLKPFLSEVPVDFIAADEPFL